MSRFSDERGTRRYWIVRGLGLGWREARKAQSSVEAFVECLRAHGRDPADYGDLCTRLRNGNGKPRLQTPEAVQRRANYATLRRLGVGVDLALKIAKSPASTQDALRRLGQGLPLRQER